MPNNKDKKAKYVSVAELAKMLGISRIAVFKKIQKGQIPAEKIGRSYVISSEFVTNLFPQKNKKLTEEDKNDIEKAKEYIDIFKDLMKK